MKKVAIIGAGPAGMAAAYQLSKEMGKTIASVEVFEAAPQVGGMAASLTLWNQTVDLGPHRFFCKNNQVNSLWLEVCGEQHASVARMTRILYRGKRYQYPLKPLNALWNLGFFRSMSAFWSYLGQKISPEKDTTSFEGWVKRRFGRKLYEIFFKSYSEKLWGIPCSELDADFASQRIRKLSLGAAIWNSLFSGKKIKHKTLADEFLYPIKGTGWIYAEMARRAAEAGVVVHLNRPVKKVLLDNNRACGLMDEDGNSWFFDAVVSTMPLTDLVTRMDKVPALVFETTKKLRFRNTILVYLNIDSTSLFPDQWLYIHSDNLVTGRITNFRNWVPQLYGSEKSSIVALEYWCFDHDALWKADNQSLIETAKSDLLKSGLMGNEQILGGHVVRLHRSYPVYFKNYRDTMSPVVEFLKSIDGLYPIGRYGAYKYNNQDHSLYMGMLAAENIANSATHDLWNVNSDYDNYQEE